MKSAADSEAISTTKPLGVTNPALWAISREWLDAKKTQTKPAMIIK